MFALLIKNKFFSYLSLMVLSISAQLCIAQNFSTHTDKIIYQKMSLYRNIMVVDGDGYRCMTFGRIYGQQSCVNTLNPDELIVDYYKGIMHLVDFARTPSSILVVGLGGGVIPMALSRAYPNAKIVSIELDPAVAQVAKTYFGYRESENISTHIGDARVYIRQAVRDQRKFEVIILDAFDKEYVPEHLMTTEFFTQVATLLPHAGFVVANTFTKGQQVPHENATYAAVFDHIYSFEVNAGNRVIFASSVKSALQSAGQTRLSRLSEEELHSAIPFTDQFSPINMLVKSN